MNPLLIPLLILFFGGILFILLAGWIYQLLDHNGVFGSSQWIRRGVGIIFLLLPILAGLVILPGLILQPHLGAEALIAGPAPSAEPGIAEGPSITTGPAIESGPRTTSNTAGGQIVYTCQIYKNYNLDQVCLMNGDGSGQRQLTNNKNANYIFPSLAPDGKSVVYVGQEGANQGYELYEMNLESGKVRQLTQNMGDVNAPAVSPDGRSIVFDRRSGNHQSLWLMNRDGSHAHEVFGPPAGDGWDAVWSPDGSQILFASNRAGGVQLFTMDIHGTDIRQVSHMEGLSGRSDWSSDGKTITTYTGGAWNHEIFLLNVDGSDVRQITNGGNNLAPSFSPDGSRIVFTSYRDKYKDVNGCEIYTLRLDGSQITRLTDNDYCDWQPRWGP
jgi:tol-pal system beta propeller repeat protein TolB